jgi:hypothetical protein
MILLNKYSKTRLIEKDEVKDIIAKSLIVRIFCNLFNNKINFFFLFVTE